MTNYEFFNMLQQRYDNLQEDFQYDEVEFDTGERELDFGDIVENRKLEEDRW